MPSYFEMLSNKATYPDGMELNLPNGEKTTFGEARGVLAARQSELDKQARALNVGKQELATVYAVLDSERLDLERKMGEFEAARASIRENTGDPEADLPPALAKRFSALESAFLDVKESIKKIKENEMGMAKTYMDDKWNREMEKAGVPEGTTREELLRLAVQEHLNDANGLPDLSKAVQRLNEPKVREKEIKEAEERGRQAAMKEMTMASLGRTEAFPTMRGPADEKPKKYKTISEAVEAAGQDENIIAALAAPTL